MAIRVGCHGKKYDLCHRLWEKRFQGTELLRRAGGERASGGKPTLQYLPVSLI